MVEWCVMKLMYVEATTKPKKKNAQISDTRTSKNTDRRVPSDETVMERTQALVHTNWQGRGALDGNAAKQRGS